MTTLEVARIVNMYRGLRDARVSHVKACELVAKWTWVEADDDEEAARE